MVVAIGLNGVVQLLQKFEAVAGDKIETADAALLQAFIGIESLSQSFRVASDELAFLSFRARHLRVETLQLIFNFRASRFGGIDKRAVKLH